MQIHVAALNAVFNKGALLPVVYRYDVCLFAFTIRTLSGAGQPFFILGHSNLARRIRDFSVQHFAIRHCVVIDLCELDYVVTLRSWLRYRVVVPVRFRGKVHER
jgi:hypothetical protein